MTAVISAHAGVDAAQDAALEVSSMCCVYMQRNVQVGQAGNMYKRC